MGAAALVAGLLSFPGGTADAQNVGPTISSVSVSSSPANALFYLTGETIRISVNFTSVVEVGGSPTLAVDVGGTEREAAFESALGSEMLFAYTVTDFDGDGVSVGADKLSLGSDDTITDSGSRAASLTHSAVAAGSGHRGSETMSIINNSVNRAGLNIFSTDRASDHFDQVYDPGGPEGSETVIGRYYYIGTLLEHGFGHTLGMPDFYKYDSLQEPLFYNGWTGRGFARDDSAARHRIHREDIPSPQPASIGRGGRAPC